MILEEKIIANLNYALIATTLDGSINYFNKSAEKILGYRSGEVVGLLNISKFHEPTELKNRTKIFSKKLAVELASNIDALFIHAKLGLANHFIWQYIHKDSSPLEMLLKVNTLYEKETLIGYSICAIEISREDSSYLLLAESQKKLIAAQRIAKVGSWTYDLVNQYLDWSDEVFNLFEIDKTIFSASYDAFIEAIHPEDRDLVNQAYENSLKTKQAYEITHRLLLSGNKIKYVHESCETIFDEKGKPLRSHGTVQDITQLKKAEKKISLLACVFAHSPDAILISDRHNKIIAVNQALLNLTKYSEVELIGKNPSILSSGQVGNEVYQLMWESLNKTGHWQGELFDKTKDGRIYPKWASIVLTKDEQGNIENYIATFSDLSKQKNALDKIEYLAHYDSLTDLLNRFSLYERFEQVLIQATRDKTELAVFFIDVDKFKAVNDSYGHHIGDGVLVEISCRLKSVLRDSDIIARLSGDEFVVILNISDNYINAADIASKILKRLGKPFSIESHSLDITTSIGVAIFPNDGKDKESLINHADIAMYHAKSKGKNNYQFFTEKMNVDILQRLSLESDLEIAVKNKDFELYYQPKIDTKSNQIISVEALIRWNHIERGFVPPDYFIPVCEEIGLICEIGEWVLHEGCQQLKSWKKQGYDIKLAINLSPKQLYDKNIVPKLQSILERYHIKKHDLELEITETVAMNDAQLAIKQLESIHQLGVDLAIDDFGTGYSSLAYLKRFPIQTLKLDKTFVNDIDCDQNNAAICKATISLAHSLGLKVVAEGVETKQQHQFLLEHGCDILQGYLFSKPITGKEMGRLLQSKRK